MKRYIVLLLFIGAFYYQLYAETPSAGMLPYAYHKGEGYVLFGLEHRTWDKSPWTQVANSRWVWTDFGGTCDAADRSNAALYNTTFNRYCAARECAEETGFVFGNPLPLSAIPKVNQPKTALFANSIRYLINNIKKEMVYTVPGGKPTYTQYFVEVSYIDSKLLNTEAVKNAHEKKVFAWVKVSELLTALNQPDDTGFYRVPSLKKFRYRPGALKKKPDTETNKLLPPLAQTLTHSRQYLKKLRFKPTQPIKMERDVLSALSVDYIKLIDLLSQMNKILA